MFTTSDQQKKKRKGYSIQNTIKHQTQYDDRATFKRQQQKHFIREYDEMEKRSKETRKKIKLNVLLNSL